jgi:hypothetical protein
MKNFPRTNVTVSLFKLHVLDPFDVIDLDRQALGKLFVPPNVHPAHSNGQCFDFEHFMTTTAESLSDSRNVELDGEYSSPADPLIVGRMNEYAMPLDGYHRAALFWKFGPLSGKMTAFVPQVLLSSFAN